MPKIRITEKDQTGRVQQGVISNVVYMPIVLNGVTLESGTFATIGETVSNQTVEADSFGVFKKFTLFSSAKDFESAGDFIPTVTIKDASVGIVETTTDLRLLNRNALDYKLCKHLLNCGFQVLVELVTAGADPSWDDLRDKSLYDIRFLTQGTLTGQDANMVATAAARGDCIALLSADESEVGFDYTATSVRGNFSISTGAEYAAAFTPWFYTNNSDFIYDYDYDATAEKWEATKIAAGRVAIPAEYGYLFAYANATKNNPEWYAIAGFERGIIPELCDVLHEYSTADIEVLQARSATSNVELDDAADNVGFAINPIAYIRPAGHIIYGNRTLRVNDASKKLIASSFLNIRNGVSAIKKLMYEASRKYTFEQNTETLWINFQAYITPLLDRMQAGNGILGYTFIKQKTDAKARLKATLNIIPVEAVEDFDLEVVLTDDLNVNE